MFLGTFAGAGPDEDTDKQEGPEISWLYCEFSSLYVEHRNGNRGYRAVATVAVKGFYSHLSVYKKVRLFTADNDYRTASQQFHNYHNNNPTVHCLKKWDNELLRSGLDYQACCSSVCRVQHHGNISWSTLSYHSNK